jgi:hypothetical protein
MGKVVRRSSKENMENHAKQVGKREGTGKEKEQIILVHEGSFKEGETQGGHGQSEFEHLTRCA